MVEYPELPLTPEPLDRYIAATPGRRGKEPSPETRHGRYVALRRLYLFLEKRRRLPVDSYGPINPFRMIDPPRVPDKVADSLDISELQRVVDACRTPQEQALIGLLSDCGLRNNEIVTLTRENVGDEFITIKGKTGQKTIDITPELRDTLRMMSASGRVFTRPTDGKPYSKYGIWRLTSSILERAGIKKRHMGPHLFRHTFGRQSSVGGPA